MGSRLKMGQKLLKIFLTSDVAESKVLMTRIVESVVGRVFLWKREVLFCTEANLKADFLECQPLF